MIKIEDMIACVENNDTENATKIEEQLFVLPEKETLPLMQKFKNLDCNNYTQFVRLLPSKRLFLKLVEYKDALEKKD